MDQMDIEQYSEIGPQYYGTDLPVLLVEYLNKEAYTSLLDCGCGDGSLLYALENSGYLTNKKVYGVDLSKKRIDLVRKNMSAVSAHVDSVEDLQTIQENGVDFLISTQVIEHVDQTKMLKAIDKVTQVGATIYLSTVFKKWYGWYFYRNHNKWVLDPTHLREYQNDSELFDFIDMDKFEILENKKTLLYFPLMDFFVKRLHIRNRRLFENRMLQMIRKGKVPVPGYYNWEIVLKKIT